MRSQNQISSQYQFGRDVTAHFMSGRVEVLFSNSETYVCVETTRGQHADVRVETRYDVTSKLNMKRSLHGVVFLI